MRAQCARRSCQLVDMTQKGTCSRASSLLFTPTSQGSGGTAFFSCVSSFPNGSRLGRFPHKSGTEGRCLYSASLYPHLISPLSRLGFFSPPFLCQSVPPSTSACQQAQRAHTRTRAHTHTLPGTLLSVVNTLAHRHKHTLRQSKSKNRGGEGEEREGQSERERKRAQTRVERERVDVDTMRRHKGFHIFPD